MMTGLQKFTNNLTAEKVLLLDFTLSEALPHGELPLVWFTAEVLWRIWRCRRDGRICRLYEVRAEIEAATNLVRRSKFGNMALVLDEMVD